MKRLLLAAVDSNEERVVEFSCGIHRNLVTNSDTVVQYGVAFVGHVITGEQILVRSIGSLSMRATPFHFTFENRSNNQMVRDYECEQQVIIRVVYVFIYTIQ